MILRHEREPIDGQPMENTFVASDPESGEVLGSAVLYVDDNPDLFPARPIQVRMELSGTPVPDGLLGAAIARAQAICAEYDSPSRIYVRCAPDDQELMDALTPFGFEDNDGLVRMELKLPILKRYPVPEGSTIVMDHLEDPLEQRYHLERRNDLFHTDSDITWLQNYIDRDDFFRILAVTQKGIAGEILCWREHSIGVIGYIQTARKWRHHGIGTFMMAEACRVFDEMELYAAQINLRARYPHAVRLANKVGFQQTGVLMRYPGIDLSPE